MAAAMWTAVLFIVLATIVPSLQASTTLAARPHHKHESRHQRQEEGHRKRTSKTGRPPLPFRRRPRGSPPRKGTGRKRAIVSAPSRTPRDRSRRNLR